MNYGVASDFVDFPSLLHEVQRVLRPGGGAFLSFYNKDLIYTEIWVSALENRQSFTRNPYTNCLEVSVGGQQVPIHAKPYGIGEVRELLDAGFTLGRSSSYPFFSSLLPSELLEALDNANDLERLEYEIDNNGQDFGRFLSYL